MDQEDMDKIKQKAKDLPEKEHTFDLGNDKEVHHDLSDVVEAVAENPPMEGLPNTPQVRTDFLQNVSETNYVKPLIHPNAIKKLGESKPLISFVGRSIATTEQRRGSVPLIVRCTMEENDADSKGNFFKVFPFKEGNAPYTVKGNFFIINNYPYLVLRFEKDQYKEVLKERRLSRKQRTMKRKDFLKKTKIEASKSADDELEKIMKEKAKKEKGIKDEEGSWV